MKQVQTLLSEKGVFSPKLMSTKLMSPKLVGSLTAALLTLTGCQKTETLTEQRVQVTANVQGQNAGTSTANRSDTVIDAGNMVYSRLPQSAAGSQTNITRQTASTNAATVESAANSNSQTAAALRGAPVNTQYQSLSALDMARQDPDFSILVEAVDAAGIGMMLRFAGDRYTIFAPNNAAFAKLFSETPLTKQSLLANKSLLRALLAYHVVKADQPMTVAQLPGGQLQALSKRTFKVTPQASLIDGKGRTAHIVQPNIATQNGMVHEIDIVMFPVN
ncbi:fasciclin domain-containing protein [Psychrobacter sp. FDAARGOS_221]|uniref:fasciclin domain-containing protein n=1 Tax=Psychrobacter sp. FDAARGOS_221 TaxID=1975705 RepID=UPI000BB53191|nr:fasciclin domain-containing protein [Psychrobacter sp. FDAARGOS_221]PNK60160.1 fasciclin [Psychrobacter sp. FDAARGOS_221]